MKKKLKFFERVLLTSGIEPAIFSLQEGDFISRSYSDMLERGWFPRKLNISKFCFPNMFWLQAILVVILKNFNHYNDSKLTFWNIQFELWKIAGLTFLVELLEILNCSIYGYAFDIFL